MSYIEEMLEHNKKFVEDRLYEAYPATKYPNKKLAILSCMDTRLTEILPAALNLKNGDAKIIKNAGAILSHPFGSVMRSLLIAVYELGVEEILVIGHHDCGMCGMEAERLILKMRERGIDEKKIEFLAHCGIDIYKWLHGFENVEDAIGVTVEKIKNHPLLPAEVRVHGFVINPVSGKVMPIDN